MQRNTAKVFGFLVLVLGLIGLVAGDKQLLEILNIDLALDLSRLVLAALLLYVAYVAKTMKAVRTALTVFGLSYLALAVGGIIDAELGGLLPNRLSNFDKVFHLLGGLVALSVAAKKDDQGEPAHAKV
jgi:hypothetical protein